MNINWTSIITNGASLTVILIALWKGFREVERAIRDSEKSKSEAEDRLKEDKAEAKARYKKYEEDKAEVEARYRKYEAVLRAQQERISVLESVADIHSEKFAQIEAYLAEPPETKGIYRIRKGESQLEQKALKRYKKINTDFT